MRQSPPPLPSARDLREADLSRFVVELVDPEEIDALVEDVTSTMPPRFEGRVSAFTGEIGAWIDAEAWVDASPPPLPGDRVDPERLVDRLSSTPPPTRVFPLEPGELDLDPASVPPPPMEPIPTWVTMLVVGVGSFVLGGVVVLGFVG